jgi:integral membrane protein (TIGR01906 family)
MPTSVRRSRGLLTALSILVTLLVPVALVLVSVRLVMTETYLVLEYNKPDFPPDFYGFTLADRLHYAPYAVQYLLSSAGIDYLGDLKMPGGGRFYNDRELAHMEDVKKVTQAALGILGAALVLLALIGVALVRSAEGRRALRQGLFGGGLLMLAILAGLLLFIIVNWDSFFTDFHELFFASGTWVFDYSDSLIRLFPVRFWQDAALTVGGLSAFGALLLMAATWWWARRERR